MLTKIAKAARTMPGIAALVAATALGGVGTAYALAGDGGVVTIKQESFEPTPTTATVEPTAALEPVASETPEPVASETPAPAPEEPTVSPKPAPEPVAAPEPEPAPKTVVAPDDPIRNIVPPVDIGNAPTGTWTGDEKTND